MFQKYQSVYNYRTCDNCNYTVVDYGKPYGILLMPELERVIVNSTLLLLFTQPNESNMRNVFRSYTKGLRDYYDISYIFVLTTDGSIRYLMKEQEEHKDMLVFDYENSYHNLVKNVLLAFHYVHNLDLPCRYIVKMDVDVAINIHRLMDILYNSTVSNNNDLYLGECIQSGYNTDPSHKHFVPQSIYQNDNYPYFARGGVYVLSKSLLPRLLVGVRHLHFITHHEDMICGRALALSNIKCNPTFKKYWLARYGCRKIQSCIHYVSIHPSFDEREVMNSYFIFFRAKQTFRYASPKRKQFVIRSFQSKKSI